MTISSLSKRRQEINVLGGCSSTVFSNNRILIYTENDSYITVYIFKVVYQFNSQLFCIPLGANMLLQPNIIASCGTQSSPNKASSRSSAPLPPPEPSWASRAADRTGLRRPSCRRSYRRFRWSLCRDKFRAGPWAPGSAMVADWAAPVIGSRSATA